MCFLGTVKMYHHPNMPSNLLKLVLKTDSYFFFYFLKPNKSIIKKTDSSIVDKMSSWSLSEPQCVTMDQDALNQADITSPNTKISQCKLGLKNISRLLFTEICPGCQCVLSIPDMKPLFCAAVKDIE